MTMRMFALPGTTGPLSLACAGSVFTAVAFPVSVRPLVLDAVMHGPCLNAGVRGSATTHGVSGRVFVGLLVGAAKGSPNYWCPLDAEVREGPREGICEHLSKLCVSPKRVCPIWFSLVEDLPVVFGR